MKKISYLLLASCVCWVLGWTLLTVQFDRKQKFSPKELIIEKAPINKELTSLKNAK